MDTRVAPPQHAQLARRRLGRPTYRAAAALGALFGAAGALVGLVSRALPSMLVRPPASAGALARDAASTVLAGVALALVGAALWRGAHRAYVALRHRGRPA